MLVGKKCCSEKNAGRKKMLVGKKSWSEKNVCRKKLLLETMFDQTKCLVRILFWLEYFFDQKKAQLTEPLCSSSRRDFMSQPIKLDLFTVQIYFCL